MDPNQITEQIIGAAISVHRELGPGLLESIYQTCMAVELQRRKIGFARELRLPILYRGIRVEGEYRLDFLFEDLVIVELKAVDRLEAIHSAQLLTYLRLSKKTLGLILNFNVPTMKDGIRRHVLGHPENPSAP